MMGKEPIKRRRVTEDSQHFPGERFPPNFCEQLQEHSFCAIKLRFEEASLLRTLDERARAMFSQEEFHSLKPMYVAPCCGGKEDASFVGLKRLKQRAIFRIRRLGVGLDMPWPKCLDLSTAAMPVLDLLESLTEQLVRKALMHAGINPEDQLFGRHCGEARRSNLGKHEIDSSPLDLFYYPNEPALSNIPNCTPHYDPGFLAIAICSKDPGFRVWDAGGRKWVNGAACCQGPCSKELQDAVVFVGESLANITGGLYPACCHAVDRHSNPRLGIVYEMQPLGGRALEAGTEKLRAGRRRCASDAGVCVLTVGTSIDGLQGMSVMQVFSLPCSCRDREQGRGAAGCHGGSGGEDSDVTSGGLEGCLLNYFLIKVLAEDASREEAESGDEEEEEGDKVARQFDSFKEDERESEGDSQAAGDAGAGAADEEGGYTLYVMRPRCNTLSCASCRCHTATTSPRDSPAACSNRGSDGDGLRGSSIGRRESTVAEVEVGRGVCQVDVAAWAQGLLRRLKFDIALRSLVLGL